MAIVCAPGEMDLMLGTADAASASPDASAAALATGVVALVRSRYPHENAATTIHRVLVPPPPSPTARRHCTVTA